MKGLTDHHKAFLVEHSGIDPAFAESLGWRSAEAGEIEVIIGRRIGSAGIVFPYPGCSGFERVRLDHPLQVEERKVVKSKEGIETVSVKVKSVKYLSPKGSNNHAYILPQVREALVDPANPIAITEGELKAVKACQEGLPTIGVAGVWSFMGKSEPRLVGDKVKDTDILAELLEIAWSGRNVWLFWDSDALVNDSVRQAGRYLQAELARRGASARLVVFREENGAKVGLDDYLKVHSMEELWAYASNAILVDAARNFDIEAIEVLLVSPPRVSVVLSWGLIVEGLDYQDILEFPRFERAVVRQTNQLPTFDTGKFGSAWKTYIADMLATRITLKAAPEEANPDQILWEQIVDYLKNRSTSDPENLLERGQPWANGKWIYFRVPAMLSFLERRHRVDLNSGAVWDVIRRRGGESRQKKILGRNQRYSVLPKTIFEDEEVVDSEQEDGDDIEVE